jgi:hypothetical protein
MSGISSIRRDWGDNVFIVRIISADNIATCTANGYLTAQAANIALINNAVGVSPPFQWYANDTILLAASDGNVFCSINASFTTLTPYVAAQQVVETNLSAAQINGMYAAPVLVVPAPAAGTVNIVKHAYLSVEFNSAQYADGGAIALQYKNTVHGAGVAASGTIAAATLNGVSANEVLLFPLVSSILLANATAQAIYISNATGAFDTGDSPAKLYVGYNNIQV